MRSNYIVLQHSCQTTLLSPNPPPPKKNTLAKRNTDTKGSPHCLSILNHADILISQF